MARKKYWICQYAMFDSDCMDACDHAKLHEECNHRDKMLTTERNGFPWGRYCSRPNQLGLTSEYYLHKTCIKVVGRREMKQKGDEK